MSMRPEPHQLENERIEPQYLRCSLRCLWYSPSIPRDHTFLHQRIHIDEPLPLIHTALLRIVTLNAKEWFGGGPAAQSIFGTMPGLLRSSIDGAVAMVQRTGRTARCFSVIALFFFLLAVHDIPLSAHSSYLGICPRHDILCEKSESKTNCKNLVV